MRAWAGPLVPARGELLQPLGVLILDADDDCEFGVRVADRGLDVARIDRCQVGIEIAGLGVRICPRATTCVIEPLVEDVVEETYRLRCTWTTSICSPTSCS